MLLLAGLFLGASMPTMALTISGVYMASQGTQHAPFIMEVMHDATGNPFDEAQIRLVAEITLPDNSTITVHGHYRTAMTRSWPVNCGPSPGCMSYEGLLSCETYTPGLSSWVVIYTPEQVGTHCVRMLLSMGQTTVQSPAFSCTSFQVVASTNPGFIRSPNAQFLQRTTGQQIFPIGHNALGYQFNQCSVEPEWPLPFGGPTQEYGFEEFKKYIDLLHAHKGSFLRIGVDAFTSISLTGYDIQSMELFSCHYNQKDAHQFDLIMQYAYDQGVLVLVTLFEHASFGNDDYAYYAWDNHNAFNSASLYNTPAYNGEDATCLDCGTSNPYDFFDLTNTCTADKTKNLLRYIISRYSHYTNIVAWELWNETYSIDHVWSGVVPGSLETLISDWHTYYADYIRQIDPYLHLITTSHIASTPSSYDALDLVTSHEYNDLCDNNDFLDADMARRYVEKVNFYRDSYQPGKPYFIGEWGITSSNECPSGSLANLSVRLPGDRVGNEFHSGLWASAFSGAAATSLSWDWVYMTKQVPPLQELFEPIGSFMNSLPSLSGTYTSSYSIDDSDLSNCVLEPQSNGLRQVVMRNAAVDTMFGYVQDISFTLHNLACSNSQYLISLDPNNRPLLASSNNTIALAVNAPNGREFRVRWYDSTDPALDFDDPASIFTEALYTANNGILQFDMPLQLRLGTFSDGVFMVTMYCEPSVWRNGALCPTAPANVAGSLVSSLNGGQVFYRTSSGTIESLWYNPDNSTYEHASLNNASGGNVAGNLLVSNSNSQLFWRTTDGLIRGMYWTPVPPSGQWTYHTLDNVIDNMGVFVASGLVKGVNDELFFRTSSNQLMAVYWNGSTWAPLAAVNNLNVNNCAIGGAYVDVNNQVFYVNTSGGISSIKPAGGGSWVTDNLNNAFVQGGSAIVGPIVRGVGDQIAFRRANDKLYRGYRIGGVWSASGPMQTSVGAHISSDASGSIFFKPAGNKLHGLLSFPSAYTFSNLDYSTQSGVGGDFATDNLGSVFYRTTSGTIRRAYYRSVCFETPSTDFREVVAVPPFAPSSVLSIYPVPSKDDVSIRFSESVPAASYVVYDLSGQAVLFGSISSEQNHLSIASLSAGVYILRVQTSNGSVQTARIVKVRERD